MEWVGDLVFSCFSVKYSLLSINVNRREWINVNIYRGVNS